MKTAKRLTKTHKHQYAKPKHRHTKDYLKVYWPYMPLAAILIMILAILSPLTMLKQRGDVLAYATNVNSQGLLDATNQQRKTGGRDALKLNEDLSEAAAAKARDMVARNYWSHNTPEDNAPWVFITKTGYDYQKAGENLAYGFDNSQQTVAGWMNSTTHRANILDPIYSDVGFGFANSDNFVGKGQSTVIVAMYARPTSLPVTATVFNDEKQNPEVYSQTKPANDQQVIGLAQVLSGGSMPWAPYVIGFVIGAAIMYLFGKHSWQLRKALRGSEKFVVNHPLLDATLVSLVVLGVLLVRQAGVIL